MHVIRREMEWQGMHLPGACIESEPEQTGLLLLFWTGAVGGLYVRGLCLVLISNADAVCC